MKVVRTSQRVSRKERFMRAEAFNGPCIACGMASGHPADPITEDRRTNLLAGTMLAAAISLAGAILFGPTPVAAQAKPPNILVIFGDDVGQSNLSAYTHGVVGYRTPNI